MLEDKIISAIVSESGTPVYIYDGDLLRETARNLSGSFEALNPHYSFKANPNIEIAGTILSAGFGAEVSSEFEARAAIRAGFTPEKIMYDGPAKTAGEIRHALSSGISHFNVESRHEAGRIISELKTAGKNITPRVCLRVNPEKASSAGEVMTGESSRFGIDEEIMAKEAEYITAAGMNINGIHLYVGSQILEESRVVENFRTGLTILSGLYEKNLLDKNSPLIFTFGPGIGVSYEKEKDSGDYSSIAGRLAGLTEEFSEKHCALSVKTEIGRLLTARAGIYVTRVVETKASRGRLYILVDGGIHHFMRYALTGAAHRTKIIGAAESGAKTPAVIGGATCTPYDMLTMAEIETPEPGALVAILDAGAYGWSMGMANFLSRPTPPEVMAEGGKWRIIREAGTFDGLTEPGRADR